MKKALLTLGAALIAMTASAAVENLLPADASTFENGEKNGWYSWGKGTSGVAEPGYNSAYCLELVNDEDGAEYDSQAAYDIDLVNGQTYVYSFWAKSSVEGGSIQIAYQNSSSYSGGGYNTINLTTEWKQYVKEITVTLDDMDRILINFGKTAGTYYIDDIVFGIEKPEEGGFQAPEGYDVVLSGNVSDGSKISAWESVFTGDATHDGKPCIAYTNEESANSYAYQIALDYNYSPETTYYIVIDVMGTPSDVAVGAWFQNTSDYSTVGGYSTFNTFKITSDTEWTQVVLKGEYEDEKLANRVAINLGEYVGTAYFTNFKVYGPAENTDGIATVGNEAKAPAGVYNLMGVKVANDVEGVAPGLYIVDGKKVIVRK